MKGRNAVRGVARSASAGSSAPENGSIQTMVSEAENSSPESLQMDTPMARFLGSDFKQSSPKPSNLLMREVELEADDTSSEANEALDSWSKRHCRKSPRPLSSLLDGMRKIRCRE